MPAAKSVANWLYRFAQETGTAGLSFAVCDNRRRNPCFRYCRSCCSGETEKRQSGKTLIGQNRETANANPANLELENVGHKTQIDKRQSAKSGTRKRGNRKPGFGKSEKQEKRFSRFAITGGVILVSGIVTIAVLAKRRKGKAVK